MKLGKKLKKVVALGTGAAMLGASVFGAMAYNLGDLPEPFVKNGVFSGYIVVGADAAASDVVGAIDIATAMQAKAVKTEMVEVEGTVNTVATAENGVLLKKDNDALSPKIEKIFASKSQLDDSDDATLLARDKVVEEDNNDEYYYDQKITFDPDGASTAYYVRFGRPDTTEFDDPVIYVNTKESAAVWQYDLSFDKTVNISEFTDNEEITILGKTFYIDPNNAEDKDVLKLYGGSDTVTLEVGEKATIKGIDVEVVGANSDNDEVTLKVNGALYTKQEGDTITVGDTDIYVKSVHLMTIPENTVVVELSVGSMTLELDFANNELKVDGEVVDGYYVTPDWDNTDKIEALNGFSIKYTPYDSEDQTEYVLAGEKLTDPVFGYTVYFKGLDTDLTASSKTEVKFEGSADVMKITFENAAGKEVTFDYTDETEGGSTIGDGNVSLHDDLVLNSAWVKDDKYFFLNEDQGSGETDITYLFKTVDVTETDGTTYVKLRDVTNGKDLELKSSKEIYDTGVYVVGTSRDLTLDSAFTGGDDTVSRDTISLVSSTLTLDSDGTVAINSDGTTYYVWETSNGDMVAFSVYRNATSHTSTVTVDGETFTKSTTADGEWTVISSGSDALNVNVTATGEVVTVKALTGKLYTVSGLKNSDYVLWTKYGGKLTLDYNSGERTSLSLTFEEDPEYNYIDNFATGDLDTFTITIDDTDATDNEHTVEIADITSGNSKGDYAVTDDGSNWEYGLSAYGTYYKYDIDGDKQSLVLYYPGVEQNVLVAAGSEEVDITVAGSASSSSVETQEVQAIPVGTAVLDTEISSTAVSNNNIISVGGPAINRVTADLMGVSYPSYGAASGIPENAGLIKLLNRNDKVALVVAGWEAEDTRNAAKVVAEYLLEGKWASALEGKTEVVVTKSATGSIQVTEPQ